MFMPGFGLRNFMGSSFLLTNNQLRFNQRFFFFHTSFSKLVNNFNFLFLQFARIEEIFVSNIALFDISLQRVQFFIKFLGFKGLAFLGLISSTERREFYSSASQFFSFSRRLNKPIFILGRYSPGLLTNWRSNIAKLSLNLPRLRIRRKFRKLRRSGGRFFRNPKYRFLSKVKYRWFYRRKKAAGLVWTFPAILLTFDSFYTLYLFSEAERLGLPVIGPFSVLMNFSFWTYTYPVFMYTPSNVLFFMRLFAVNYLKGKLNFFFLRLKKSS